MTDPADEHVQALLDLAATDSAIRRNNVALENLPENQVLADIAEQQAALKRRRADLRLERDQAEAAMQSHERNVSHLRERLAAEQQRMYEGSITNAKELAMLEAEIASVQSKVDEQELAALQELEAYDTLASAIDDIDQTLADLDATHDETLAARDESGAELIADNAELEVTRERQRADLPDDLVDRYDESAARSSGAALGELDGQRCTACGIGLSYANVNELLEGPPLATCPNCDRLIVVR